MKILKGRRPFDEVINDQRTDEETRRKLLLARQARAFAIHMLGLDAGDSYTSFTQLETDTLAWVLSAAYRDRLESKTWWFPIVGRVPYKGYASERAAEKAEAKLETGGTGYLSPHHLGLQHPGMVRRPSSLQPSSVRRRGPGGDDPP